MELTNKCTNPDCEHVFTFSMGDSPFGIAVGNQTKCPRCDTWQPLPSTEIEADLKFGHLETQLLEMKYASFVPASAELVPVAMAFTQNVDRVVALAVMPRMLALNVGFAAKRIRYPMGLEFLGEGREFPSEALDHLMMTATLTDMVLARLPNKATYLALEGVLSSIILGAWTAFEALATDLWVTALNANPKLGVRALGAEVKPNDDDSEKRRKAKLKQSFPIQRLHKHDYNIKNAMGSLLRDSKKWDFGRPDETCDAYKAAFGVKASDNSELDSIFDNLELQWLAALRNAFIHRGGIADESFLSLVDQHPTLKKSEPDKPIILDGQLAQPLIENAAGCGAKLISFVDARLNV